MVESAQALLSDSESTRNHGFEMLRGAAEGNLARPHGIA